MIIRPDSFYDSSPLFLSAESVTEGHPDKVCDQVSDAILDAHLTQDSEAKVACECFFTKGVLLIGGEITSHAQVDYIPLAREILKSIGYRSSDVGLDFKTCSIITLLNKQSPEIEQAINKQDIVRLKDPLELLGAGDQGTMVGMACSESDELLPLPLVLSHQLTRRLAEVRKSQELTFLRPDGKSQVTCEYKNGRPCRVQSVVLSAQHDENIPVVELREYLQKNIIDPVFEEFRIDSKTQIHINSTDRFVLGGPLADTGLTGRKILVDSYGPLARHGGGSFSGKDPSKVDRSGAYYARYIAKNIVAARLAEKVEVHLSYVMGQAEPEHLSIETFGTYSVEPDKILQAVQKLFDPRPAAIINELSLRKVLYQPLACYGHFGRADLELPWERTDKVEELKHLVR